MSLDLRITIEIGHNLASANPDVRVTNRVISSGEMFMSAKYDVREYLLMNSVRDLVSLIDREGSRIVTDEGPIDWDSHRNRFRDKKP